MRGLALLALGAIVNVAVAWGCVVWLPSREDQNGYEIDERQMTDQESAALIELVEPGGVDPGVSYGAVTSRFGWEMREATWLGDANNTSLYCEICCTTAGLPTTAFRGHWAWDSRTTKGKASFSGAIMLPEWIEQMNEYHWWGEILPFHPVWPGFAINTVFYAALLWLLFAGPFVLRRRRRIRRGLCPKCAYDLRGSVADVCPECGSPNATHPS